MGGGHHPEAGQAGLSYPIHIWQAWPQLARRLGRAPRLALFSDFDGTLAPIVPHPWQARLPGATRAALALLARAPRVSLGVVSGRQLSDLRRLVGLKNVCYIGSHGLQWVLPGQRPHLEATPAQRSRIRKIGAELQRRLRALPGIWVERKVVSVAVHYRTASPWQARRAVAQVARLARHQAPHVKLLKGKKIVELLPAGAASKARAVRALLARQRSPLVVYLGDDVTDENVFACLGKTGLGIFVGRPRASRARFRLSSPQQVCQFLERLCKIIL